MHRARLSWIIHGAVNEALTRIDRRASRIARGAIVGVRLLFFVLFLGSIALTIDGSIVDSLPLRILLALVTAVPMILQTIDWLWRVRWWETFLERLQSEIERRLRRRWERRLFEWYGAEELAQRRGLDAADMPYFSVSRRTLLRRQRRIGAGVAALLVASALIGAQLVNSSTVHYFAVGQEFQVDGTFAMTVRGAPSCRPGRGLFNGPECDVSVVVHNISHYGADIGAGSFGPIQAADTNYGASLVSHGNYYDYADAKFDSNSVSPGGSTSAMLEFSVPTGVTPGELRISALDRSGVSVVSFRGNRS